MLILCSHDGINVWCTVRKNFYRWKCSWTVIFFPCYRITLIGCITVQTLPFLDNVAIIFGLLVIYRSCWQKKHTCSWSIKVSVKSHAQNKTRLLMVGMSSPKQVLSINIIQSLTGNCSLTLNKWVFARDLQCIPKFPVQWLLWDAILVLPFKNCILQSCLVKNETRGGNMRLSVSVAPIIPFPGLHVGTHLATYLVSGTRTHSNAILSIEPVYWLRGTIHLILVHIV